MFSYVSMCSCQFSDIFVCIPQSSTEFRDLVETVLEGTIYNLMQEADVGEFDMTKHRMEIVQ